VFAGRYGECLAGLGRDQEAEVALREAHRLLCESLGAEHERTRQVVGILADLYERLDQPEQAVAWRQKLGPAASHTMAPSP
jgi:hypothetical protein